MQTLREKLTLRRHSRRIFHDRTEAVIFVCIVGLLILIGLIAAMPLFYGRV